MPAVTINQRALPWPILVILLVGYFVLLIVMIRRAQFFKSFAADFPTHSGTVVVGLALATITAPMALSMAGLGIDAPNGWGDWLAFVAALCGLSIAGMGVKRFTDTQYVEAKARGKAAGDTGTFPSVNVEGDATVNASTQPKPAVTVPQAGARPTNPEVVRGVEAIAEMQRVPLGQGTSNE